MSDTNSVGWVSGPIGNAPLEGEGAGAFESGAFEREPLFQDLGRVTTWLTDPSHAALALKFNQPSAAPFIQAEQPATIDTDTANAEFGVPDQPGGVKGLKFDHPVPRYTAQAMNEAKQEEIERAFAKSRASGIASGLATFGAGGVGMLLDPVDLASMFVPVAGEAKVMGYLARAGLTGATAGERIAARAATGALAGMEQQALLSFGRYGIARSTQEDYSASDALAEVMMGGLIGGGLHAVAGPRDIFARFANTPERAIVEASPEAREATARASVAAVAEGRPVEVADLIALHNEREVQQIQVRALRREVQALRDEAAGVPEGAPVDEATRARLDAIDEQLTAPGALPSRQHAELMQERQMLTEGAARPDGELEVARSAAQREGLLIAAQRTEQRIGELQAAIARSETVRRATGEPAPDVLHVQEQANAAQAAPPKVEPTLDRVGPEPAPEETTALEKWAKEAQGNDETPSQLRGMMTREERAQLDAMEEATKQTGKDASVYDAIAACIIGRA